MMTWLLSACETSTRIPAHFIREALRRADISVEKACLYIVHPKTGKPKDRAQFARELDGIGHLRYSDLCQLPIRFWQHLGMVILQELGMPREMRHAVVFALALHGKKSMARMKTRQRQEVSA